jgi:hypothetical protein
MRVSVGVSADVAAVHHKSRAVGISFRSFRVSAAERGDDGVDRNLV